MQKDYVALEIDSPKIVEMLSCLDPTIGDINYEEVLHGSFLVIGFPEPGKYMIMPPQTIGDIWDHIEPINLRGKFVLLVNED